MAVVVWIMARASDGYGFLSALDEPAVPTELPSGRFIYANRCARFLLFSGFMQTRVTMAIIAQELGLSVSTVSRALKGDLRIGEKTRQCVKACAMRLGYRPDPLVSALMATRKKRTGNGEVGTIALVTDYHGSDAWQTKDVCRWEYEGICQRAEDAGYRMEEFPMSAFSGDAPRLARTLKTRGIRGVLLGFTRDRRVMADFPLEDFSVAGLSTYFREVPVNRANFHGFYNVQLALQQIRLQGFKRTGLVVPELNNRVSGSLWSGAALDWLRHLSEEDRCQPLVAGHGEEEGQFLRWLKQEQPDSLLVYRLPVRSWLSKIGQRVPQDMYLSYLYRTAEEMAHWPGVDGNLQHVGAAAFDLVIEGLHTHRSGLPSHPKEVLIKGEWKTSP